MKHIIVLCSVILCCCGTLFSHDAHKGKEFYMAPDTFKTQGQQTIQNNKCLVKPEKPIKTAKQEAMPWE